MLTLYAIVSDNNYEKNIFFIGFFIVVDTYCQSSETQNEIEFEIVMEDLVNNYNLPTDGYYYEYQFENQKVHINNVENILREYIKYGIELLDAWYKHGRISCSPPDSKYAMYVIVRPNFVLRTKSPSNFLLNRNFVEVDKPPRFFCGYSVRHYIPKYN